MTALLVVGYVLAVPLTLFVPGFLRMWRTRDHRLFAVAQTGAALITLGWLLDGAVVPVVVNASWLVGFTVAYVLEGRRRARVG